MKLNVYILFYVFLFIFGLDFSFAQTQTPLFLKKYRGSFNPTTQYSEVLLAPSNQLIDYYKLTIKNGDGVVFAPKVCSGNWIQKLTCNLSNSINSFLSNSNKVDWAKIVINNVEIVSSTQINKTKVYYETVLKLKDSNQLNTTLKGSILSYIQVELKYLGEAVDQTPPVITSNVSSGALTKSNLIHISVTDKSSVTNDIYKDNILLESNSLKEFDIALSEGSNNFVIRSKDSLNNQSQDFILNNVILDTLPPSLVSDLSSKYTVDVLPAVININFVSNEELSLVEIDGQGITLLTSNSFQYSQNILQGGEYSFSLKAKDKIGNELSRSFSFIVEERFSLSIISPLKDESLTSSLVNINIKSNKILSALYVNDKLIALSEDRLSGQTQIKIPIHGKYSLRARAVSGSLEKNKDITFEIGKNSIAPWAYEECPAQ